MALELVGSGLDVVVVEAGGIDHDRGTTGTGRRRRGRLTAHASDAALRHWAGDHAGLHPGGGSAAPGTTDDGCDHDLRAATGGLAVIGERYLSAYPDDDLTPVVELLGAGAELREIEDAVRADFDRGDVVDVDGWVLSRTEARATALLVHCGR